MLMQESIKKVINIHKCKFSFLILCGLTGQPARAARLYGSSPHGPTGSLPYPAPRFFCKPGRRSGLNCHPYIQVFIMHLRTFHLCRLYFSKRKINNVK